ncbi:outer membrane beta-barrel protein [Flavobacterium sp. ARAG 55.4]|uniref:outer membrane beta-barrel protein n=1 Tax=Flavobacterium sp. ARAG 55.4 TaxID=3451357 RepID=UPI003F48283B
MSGAKKLLYFLSLISFSFSFGQITESYSKGVIILKNDQKKEGFIKNESLDKYCNEVKFKALATDTDFEIYSPSIIKSFTTEKGLVFESLIFKVNKNTPEINILAQLLLKGRASLYQTYYESQPIYIITNDDVPYVLKNDELKRNDTEITKFHYRGILNIATENYTANRTIINFKKKEFINAVSGYNKSVGSEIVSFETKEKPITYFISFGGIGKGEYDNVVFFQGIYRIFFPNMYNTSLNIGLNYYNEKYDYKTYYSLPTEKITSELYSIPFTIQQNIFSKNVRPYLFGGFGLTKIKEVNQDNKSIIESGFQKNIGFSLVYGVGIEWDIYKGITSKVEYRNELVPFFLAGIGYNFSK